MGKGMSALNCQMVMKNMFISTGKSRKEVIKHPSMKLFLPNPLP